MKYCVLDNDVLDPEVAPLYTSYGAMFERLLRGAGAQGTFEIFNTTLGQYPASFDDFDAVLLTGSRADAFSQEAWVRVLRARVEELLQVRKKLIGICFGHQLIALCLGARVGRAVQGWGVGRLTYQWHAPELAAGRTELSLLASHQDQVGELPRGAKLLASSKFCPVAAFSAGQHVFCVQPHPEFVEDYNAYLLGKRRELLGEETYNTGLGSLALDHDGLAVAQIMRTFLEDKFEPNQPLGGVK